MSEYLIQSETLGDIADAIRSKTGGSALINPENMASEIESIPSGGGDDTSPYELYKTSFVPVSDSASVTFSLPPLSEKDITFVFGVVDNPASYLSESNINKITGFTRTHFYTGMVGGVADGVYFGNDVRAISAIDTASSADYWQSGVTMTINKEAQTYTISNTKGKTFIAGANYTVWAVFKDR